MRGSRVSYGAAACSLLLGAVLTGCGADSNLMPSRAMDTPAGEPAEVTPTVEVSAPAAPVVTARNGLIAGRVFLDPTRTTSAISTVAADGSAPRQITRPPTGTLDDHPDWAPDGRTIAFDRRVDRAGSHLWTVDTAGGDPRQLPPLCTDGAPDCLNENEDGPAFSPDGKLIAFSRSWGTLDEERHQIQYSDLFVTNADGGNLQRVTMLTNDKPFSGSVRNPSWSPDGTQLAFEYRTSSTGQPAAGLAVFVVNADGTGLRQLTPWALRAGERASWSPDGSHIVFTTFPAGADDNTGGGIYTVHPDGSAVTALTPAPSNATYGLASFSPDGQLIAFAQTPAGANSDIYTMKSDGSGVTRLTNAPGSWQTRPAWGPAAQ